MSHSTDHDAAGTHGAKTFVEDMDRGWGAWVFGALVCLVFALLIYLLRQYAATAHLRPGFASGSGVVGNLHPMIEIKGRYNREVLCAVAGDTLEGADLAGAELGYAQLSQMDLSGAILQGANLQWAFLDWAVLSEANLQGANLERAYLQCANLPGADLRGANLGAAHLREAFMNEGTLLEGAVLTDVIYDSTTRWPPGFNARERGATWFGPYAELEGLGLGCLDLHHANLRSARLARADLTDACLTGANLEGADLRGAALYYVEMIGASLVGANLEGAELASANLTGVLYDHRTRWPAGFDPEAHGCILISPVR